MYERDYYQILQVTPEATAEEIRKSYRKLAFKYHPDKNHGDNLTEAVFRNINEAYEVLSNAEKREEYNRKIFSYGNSQRNKKYKPVTSYSILQEAIELSKLVASANTFKINRDALLFQIQNIVSPYNLSVLTEEPSDELKVKIVQYILKSSTPLQYSHVEKISSSLFQIAGDNAALMQELNTFIRQKKVEQYWNKYKILMVVIIAVLLCFIIYSMKL